jgi:hypothetical protein
MNKYLLLRDNKQTGPYSLEELVAKGIKAYDLVWLDGKSAAWRYPSEIEELKPYSPVVEEQPYDRFYKKTTEQEKNQDQSALIEAREKLTRQEPVAEPLAVLHEVRIESETNNTNPQRKIFVTMPAASNGSRIVKRPETPKEERTSSPISEKNPVTEEKKPVQRESTTDPVSTSFYQQEKEPAESFSQLLENKYSAQDEKVVNIRSKQKTAIDRKLVSRIVIALCLLLGGVVIGLVISNANQKSKNQDLDDLVKQIRQRDQKLQEQSKASLPLSQPEVLTSANESDDVKNDQPTNIPEKKEQAPVAREDKKTSNPVSSVEKNQDKPVVSNTSSTDNDIKVTPAVIAPKKNEAAMEAARKNINQLVSVESNKYKTGVLGGISDLRLTISNNSLFQLDRVEVEIRYLGPEKRVVKTQTLLFNDVPPGKQITLDAPKTSRGVSIDYSIRTINSKELGLAHSGF